VTAPPKADLSGRVRGQPERATCASRTRHADGQTRTQWPHPHVEMPTSVLGPLVVRRDGHVLFEKEVEASELYLVYDVKLVDQKTMDAISALLEGSGVNVYFR